MFSWVFRVLRTHDTNPARCRQHSARSKLCYLTTYRPFTQTIFSPLYTAWWPPTTALPLLSQSRAKSPTPEVDSTVPSRKLGIREEKCFHCYLQEQQKQALSAPLKPSKTSNHRACQCLFKTISEKSPYACLLSRLNTPSPHSCTKGSLAVQG